MHPVIAAALWMGGALTSFMVMAVAGRELSDTFNTYQILFWRGLVGLTVILPIVSISGWHLVKTHRPGLHLARNLIHFVAQYGWFFGLASIPLAQVFAIEFTTPIWTMLLAVLFLGEAVTRWRLFAVGLGFVGILIILRPGFVTVELAQLAVLGAAFGYASSYIFTKKLVETDTPLAVLFYMTVIQVPLGLVTSLTAWRWPDPGHYVWIVLVGVTALSAHYCFSRALQLADATVVTPIDFLRLPIAAILGYFLYGQPIEIWVLAGAVFIFIGILANVRAEARRAT